MAYGLTSSGFVPEPLAQILADLQAALQAAFGTDVDLDPRGPFGLLIGIMAEREATLWQMAAAVYAAAYPDTASSTALDDLCSVTGVFRLGATSSQDSVVLVGTNGTSVPSGTLLATAPNGLQFQTLSTSTIATLSAWASTTAYAAFSSTAVGALVTNAGNIYACTSPIASAATAPTGTGASIVDGSGTWRYIAAGSAAAGVLVAATATGPTTAPAGTLTVVTTPVAGLSSVVNPIDASPGRAQETDAALRIRRAQQLEASGSAPVLAIRAAMLAVSGVISAAVYENQTDTTDGAGRPPHSVECVVQGGISSTAIAQTLWQAIAAGINTTGATSGTATDSLTGTTYTMNYTVPTLVSIYVVITVKKGATYPATGGAAAVKAAMIAYANGLDSDIPGDAPYAVGQTVYAGPLAASVFDQVAGVADVTSCFIGTSASPSTSTPLAMTYAQLPSLQSANITVIET